MASKKNPVCLALSRQNLAVYEKADKTWKTSAKKFGAYIVQDGGAKPDITILATGSEVNMALAAAKLVPNKKIRVVSVLDKTIFDSQKCDEKKKIFGGAPRVVVAEAGVSMGWEGYATK